MKLKTKHLLVIAAVAIMIFLWLRSKNSANAQAAGVTSALSQVGSLEGY